jgi:hypothetical protein
MAQRTSPVADLQAASGSVGQPIVLDGSASSSPTGTIKRWSLDFGDGSTPHEAKGAVIPVEHVYTAAEEYFATLTVYDNRGSSATDRELVRVEATSPEPVNCVQSEWALVSRGEWTDCINGTRTRQDVYDRTVLTEPANGGAECGPSTKTVTITEDCTVEPPTEPPPDPPASGDAHDFYNALVPSAKKAYSFRDQAQLRQYSQKAQDGSQDINYIWPNDPDPRKQDAAKLVIPSDGSGIKSPTNRNSIYQVRVPMPPMTLGKPYLIIVDAYYGDEWRQAISGIDAHKAYQLDGPDRPGGSAKIWWEVNQGYKGNVKYPVHDQDEVCHCRIRHYAISIRQGPNGAWFGVPVGPNVSTGSHSLTPCEPHTPFMIRPQKWTRYYHLIEYGMDTLTIADYNGGPLPEGWPDQRGTLMSLWVTDEDREAVQVYNRAQVTLWTPGIRQFWHEFNTSLDTIKAGRPNLVAYFRNVLMFEDVGYGNVPGLLRKPVR